MFLPVLQAYSFYYATSLLNGASDDALSFAQYRFATDHDQLVTLVKKAAETAVEYSNLGPPYYVYARVFPTAGYFRRLRSKRMKMFHLDIYTRPLWRGEDGKFYIGSRENWRVDPIERYSVKLLRTLLNELEALLPSTANLYWGDGKPES